MSDLICIICIWDLVSFYILYGSVNLIVLEICMCGGDICLIWIIGVFVEKYCLDIVLEVLFAFSGFWFVSGTEETFPNFY